MYENFYNEIEPAKRLEILDSLPESEDSKIMREIYNDRFSDHEGKKRKNIDWWLWRCVCLQILCNRGKLFRKSRDREVLKIITELHTDINDEPRKKFLYNEYRNTAKRYLSTCKSGSYASSFLGLRQASEEEKIYHACLDIWQMSAGVAKSSGLTDKMQNWIDALRDELMIYSPLCRAEYERLNQ
ncbi:MAG: hypothetical protein IJT21_05925 [Synergistaceae bacterium]|nr:hypothetical protein [Synergistaceae bacterium]